LRLLLFEQLDLFVKCFRLLLSANTQFFYDLEDTPKTQDDNQRSDFFEDATQKDVYDEARYDDGSIKTVELGSEEAVMVSIITIYIAMFFSLEPECPYTRQQFKHEQAGEHQTNNTYHLFSGMASRFRYLSFTAEDFDEKLGEDTSAVEGY
jgi:hypothetical protein